MVELVAAERVELSILQAFGFKPNVYANSTTPPYLVGSGGENGIRTHTEPVLSRLPLPNWDISPLCQMVEMKGFEPSAFGLQNRCSTD